MTSTICKDATAALHAYLRAEAAGDLPATLALLSPDHCGFGTGPDEVVMDLAQARAILTRQFAQASEPLVYDAEIVRCVEIGDLACVVMARIVYRVQIAGAMETLRLRFTFVMQRGVGGWQVKHLHASVPWSMQAEGESFPIAEIEQRNRELERLVAERTRELERTLDLVQRLAITDKLTGLANRTKLDELIADEHRYLARHKRPSSIAIMDLDLFKTVNDTHGHMVGDRVLQELATILTMSVREVDRVGRWGGEEFLILMPGATAEGARGVGERIRRRLAEHDFRVEPPITVSIGIAEHRDGESTDAWLSRADDMLYQAKRAGRDRIVSEP